MQPGPVQRPLKLLGGCVGGGGGQILKCTSGLPCAGVQEIQKLGALVGLLWGKARRAIDLVIVIEGLFSCFLEKGVELSLGFAGEPLEVVADGLPGLAQLLQAPGLPLGGVCDRFRLDNAPGHILQNILLHLAE